MGEIRERLGGMATYFDKEQLAVKCQLEYVGFAIESEIEQLKEKLESIQDETCRTFGRHDCRIEALEEFKKQIEALIDLRSFREWLDSLKIKKSVPTDKDRPFQVGDTIAYSVNGDIRIVLGINPDNTMRLMEIPSGYKQGIPALPRHYTLIYRPGSPKPVPTVKEKIATDRFGKPPGGLEPGDVLEYHSPRYRGRIEAIFIGQTSDQRHSGWIEAYRVCDGEVSVIDIEVDDCKFKFRPRFPDRKER